MRFSLVVLAALAAAVFTACPPPADGNTPPPQECPANSRTCDSDRVCAGGFCDKDHDSADGTTGDGIAAADDDLGCCVILVCTKNDDCKDDERCDIRRGICVPLGLCNPEVQGGGDCLQRDGTSGPCCSGDKPFCEYSDGNPTCVASPPDASNCVVAAGGRPLASAPGDTEAAPGAVSSGSDLQLEATGTDANGKNIAHSTFTWSGDGVDATTGVLNSTCATGVCPVTVTATSVNGGAACTGVVNVYAPPTLSNRIVVLDLATGEPVANATAAATIAGTPVSGTTDANGAAEFDGVVTAISAFPDDYQWQTIVDPPADVIVYTAHVPDQTKVAGISGTFNFDNVHTTGDIKLGLSGTAISSAITDLNFNTLIGEIADYNVELEGITDPGGQLVPLPSGIVIELGSTPIKGDFVTFGDPGSNIAWAIGGQVALSEVGPIISGVAGGGDVNVGNILGGVLPFFARFDHALQTGLTLTNETRPRCDNGGFTCSGTDTCDAGKGTCVTANGDDVPIDTSVWGFQNVELNPNTLLSQSVDYTVPRLPCAPGQFSGGNCTPPAEGSAFQTGAVLLSGVIVPGTGLVPLGLTAGLDDPDDQDGNDQVDGLIDSADTVNGPAHGHAIIDYAPPHDGLEGNTLISVAIALDLGSITGGSGGLGASIVTHVTKKFEAANTFPANAFLESQGGAFTPDDGTGNTGHFAMATVGDGADFWRVNLDNGGDVEWNVWFSSPTETFDIKDFNPDPAAAAARATHADVQAFKLGAGYGDIGPEPSTYGDLFTFNGTNLDNLLYYLGAWSSQSCDQGAVCSTP